MSGLAVVGGGGWVGRSLFSALNKAGFAHRALTHDEARAESVTSDGLQSTVRADLTDPDSLRRAFDGIDVVYAIPPALAPREDELMINAIRAAEASGVTRFVYHSVLHANTPFLRNHLRKARVEVALKDSALRWTILQPSMYAQVVAAMFGHQTGTVPVPFNADSVISVIDLADCAQVALTVIDNPGLHDYATYELAGPETTMRQAVKAVAAARGVELSVHAIDVTAGPIPPSAKGNSQSAADMVSTYAHYDRHGFRGCSVVLGHLLGRVPTAFEDFATREFAAVRA